MNRSRLIGRILPVLALATLCACAGPVPRTFVSASHETIVTAPPRVTPAANGEQQTLDLARKFVFRVRNVDCGLVGTSFFAGGYLFTNRHVAAGAETLELSNWDGEDFTDSVLGHSGNLDLARMTPSVPADAAPVAVSGSDPLVGGPVYVAGYPEGDQLTVSSGNIIASVPGSHFGMAGQVLVVSNQVKPGNSGSPLLDVSGKVVGVVFAEDVTTHDGLAIPVSSLNSFRTGAPATSRLPCAHIATPHS